MRSVLLVMIVCCALGLAGCRESANHRVLVVGGTSVGEPTVVAYFHEIAVSTREPNLCSFLSGLTGRDALDALERLLAQAFDVTPTAVPEGGDVDRAGDLLAEQCQKFYEDRKH